jgi:DEAD/DEAH box helicase domain-containing protein
MKDSNQTSLSSGPNAPAGPAVDTILGALRRDHSFMRNVVAWEKVPRRPARHAPPPAGLDDELARLLRQQGTWPLYTHQVLALQAALRGENVVVVTGTASGKTLCYNLPVLQILRADPGASALYLFPTKALAQDQLAALSELLARMEKRPPLHLYDGDTPASRRPTIRQAGGVILSNPDMLHAGILPHHTRWAHFFAGLRIVVLDEIHTYRGVFGSHLANLLRRLRRICQLYGSAPRFVCTSATIANPAEHAQRLIEAPVTLIPEDQDGSPQGERHFILYNPPMVDPALGIRQSALTSSAEVGGEFLRAGVQTILFARSRLATELLLTTLRDRLAPDTPAEKLQAYRGGYLPHQRRAIERGLRQGDVRGVVGTNALELGVDIGEMSACVLMGYPGTIASTRQQAGRAGRRLSSSAAVLVATALPLDQYIATHPHFLFGQSPEHALINPDNLVILVSHLQCAAFELPFETGETFGGAGRVDDILDFLAQEGLLHRSSRSYHWVADSYPAASISLRSGSSESVVIQDVSDPDGPVVIGQLERESAPLLLHEGAIYPHQGATYLVERLDWDDGRADVRQVSVEFYTRASMSSTLQVLAVDESAQVGPVWKHHGRVQVTSQATAYRRIKRTTHETLDWGEIDLPSQTLETTAYWLSLTPELAARLEAAGVLPGSVDYGPNWAEQKRKALARDGGRCQSCGARERPGRRHDVHHIQPFRAFGYLPGANDHYLHANDLRNLVTLCPSCHRRAESQMRVQSSLAGLGSVLRNLAPLYLMCDVHDIFVLTEAAPVGEDGPKVTIYERVPAGVGFSQQLYELHGQLLIAAQELIRACPCQDGCPACVGPAALAAPEALPKTKAVTLQLLAAMVTEG